MPQTPARIRKAKSRARAKERKELEERLEKERLEKERLEKERREKERKERNRIYQQKHQLKKSYIEQGFSAEDAKRLAGAKMGTPSKNSRLSMWQVDKLEASLHRGSQLSMAYEKSQVDLFKSASKSQVDVYNSAFKSQVDVYKSQVDVYNSAFKSQVDAYNSAAKLLEDGRNKDRQKEDEFRARVLGCEPVNLQNDFGDSDKKMPASNLQDDDKIPPNQSDKDRQAGEEFRAPESVNHQNNVSGFQDDLDNQMPAKDEKSDNVDYPHPFYCDPDPDQLQSVYPVNDNRYGKAPVTSVVITSQTADEQESTPKPLQSPADGPTVAQAMRRAGRAFMGYMTGSPVAAPAAALPKSPPVAGPPSKLPPPAKPPCVAAAAPSSVGKAVPDLRQSGGPSSGGKRKATAKDQPAPRRSRRKQQLPPI